MNERFSTHRVKPTRKTDINKVATSEENPNSFSKSSNMPETEELAMLERMARVVAKHTKYHLQTPVQF